MTVLAPTKRMFQFYGWGIGIERPSRFLNSTSGSVRPGAFIFVYALKFPENGGSGGGKKRNWTRGETKKSSGEKMEEQENVTSECCTIERHKNNFLLRLAGFATSSITGGTT